MIILALGLFLKASIAAEPVSPEVAPIIFIFLLPLSKNRLKILLKNCKAKSLKANVGPWYSSNIFILSL